MYTTYKDLIGEKFDKLTVIDRAEDSINKSGHKRRNWKCQCECGNVIVISEKSLKKKHKHTCRRCPKIKEGEKYGRWTVLEYRGLTNDRRHQWLCVCECGTQRIVREKDLLNSKSQSCGCLRRENTAKDNIRRKKSHPYICCGNYCVGFTGKGELFYFDTEDLPIYLDRCWIMNSEGYVRSGVAENGIRKSITFHRVVMNCPDGMLIDHIDHNPANNRKSNLRIVTSYQNSFNKPAIKSSSGRKGVYKRKEDNKWVAAIRAYGKSIYLGAFIDLNDAIAAREQAEMKYQGEYAYDPNKDYRNQTSGVN